VPEAILVLNCGSSSLRLALAERRPDGSFARRHHAHYDNLGHDAALEQALAWVDALPGTPELVAVGHRIVHGGSAHHAPAVLDATLLAQLESLVALAPLHQPQALAAVRRLAALRPQLLQVACFDTSFHRTMPWHEQHLALPSALHALGVQRYGFHGLSYEYVAGELARQWGDRAQGRIVIAHLGQGSSLCALRGLASQATSMGFTPLDGVPMATRAGAVDAAVPLFLFERGMDTRAIRSVLHEQSGLLGLSGISGDMRTLLADGGNAARQAVHYYCHHVARALASLAAAVGGLDAVVFTGGIGQHAPAVRAAILQQLQWLGLQIDPAANEAAVLDNGAACITRSGSPVPAWVMATDEEAVITAHTSRVHRERTGAPHGAGG
jgi:acetate kinase